MNIIARSITRRHARECTLQALYSWKLSQNNAKDIIKYVIAIQHIESFNISYFHELYFGIINYTLELDRLMRPYLLCNLKSLGYIEYFILQIALFELTKCCDVPYRVVINEAIELTKRFGSEKSYKFVNGVLNAMLIKLL